MAKQAVAVKEVAGAVALPDFMKEHSHLGTEALGAGDVEIPRIKLMQALSPELEEFNDLKQGDFFHTLAEQNLGKELRVTPIYVDSRFILWRPRESGGGILARADDGKHWSPADTDFQVKLKGGAEVRWRTAKTVEESGLAEWGSSNPSDPNSPPAATKMYNLVVTLPDIPDLPPAVVTLQRASISVARRFIGKLKISRAPSFGLVFTMSSFKDKNDAGQDFYNYQFRAAGMVEDKTVYEQNYEYYNFFRTQGVKVKDIEGVQDDDIGGPAAAKDAPAF